MSCGLPAISRFVCSVKQARVDYREEEAVDAICYRLCAECRNNPPPPFRCSNRATNKHHHHPPSLCHPFPALFPVHDTTARHLFAGLITELRKLNVPATSVFRFVCLCVFSCGCSCLAFTLHCWQSCSRKYRLWQHKQTLLTLTADCPSVQGVIHTGTRRHITVVISVRHWMNSVHALSLTFIPISISYTASSPKWPFPSRLSDQNFVAMYSLYKSLPSYCS
jgi:hypothetical protein